MGRAEEEPRVLDVDGGGGNSRGSHRRTAATRALRRQAQEEGRRQGGRRSSRGSVADVHPGEDPLTSHQHVARHHGLLPFTVSKAVLSLASEERRPTPAASDAVLGLVNALCNSPDVCVWLALMTSTGDEGYPGSTPFCLLCRVQFAACCSAGDRLAVHISKPVELTDCPRGTTANEKSSNDEQKCNAQSHLAVN